MHGLIVVTGLDQFASSERWPRLIEPLAAELEASGLGELPDLAALQSEFRRHGSVEAAELAVRLANLDYGRELVARVVGAAGVERPAAVRPERWREFRCDDYYSSDYCRDGYWDERGQYWYLVPFDRVFEDEASAFLDVGGAGVDGIRFGYRRGHAGVWAYPVDGEFVFLADTVDACLQGWLAGRITV